MVGLLLAIYFTRMPKLKENDKSLDFKGTWNRLKKTRNYIWGVLAQFFYVGAQIAVWSFIIRYVMQQLKIDAVIAQLGPDATTQNTISALRHVGPVAAGFYPFVDAIGLDALLPRTVNRHVRLTTLCLICL